MWSYSAWRRRRILRRDPIPSAAWERAFASIPVLAGLQPQEQRRLRELAVLFLHEKSVEPATGLVLSDALRVALALQACLPILNLGLQWYEGWISVIVYPTGFLSRRREIDDIGLVHEIIEPLSGEAWLQGPVIVSWEDIEQAEPLDGYNPLLHELAHKLDMLDGSANGSPPLHAEMDGALWAESFLRAYDQLRIQIDRGERPGLDPYALEAPEEFFAVATEAFFETPRLLTRTYPDVYARLTEFYRQDPGRRL